MKPTKYRQLAAARGAFTGHLNSYYQAVIASLRDAESILIFGPGEAKGDLRERLEKCNRGGLIVSVETVDKMTDRQIAAKVRKGFPKLDLPIGSN
jgi:hypothetical protein